MLTDPMSAYKKSLHICLDGAAVPMRGLANLVNPLALEFPHAFILGLRAVYSLRMSCTCSGRKAAERSGAVAIRAHNVQHVTLLSECPCRCYYAGVLTSRHPVLLSD